MATQSFSYQEVNNRSSTWSHVFQAPNTSWLGFDQRLFIGNFFLGLQGQTNLQFNTQIPPGSTIISAELETQPFTAFFGNNDIQINSPDRSLQLQKQDPLQSPFEIHRGYRRDMWGNAQTGALSTTFTAIWGTSVTTNANWIMRQLTAPGGTIPGRAHLAQRVTTRTGNMTMASSFWEMRRVGSPSGDLRMRIQGVTTDRGVTIPDGVDVAVSDPVLATSVPTTDSLVIFTWLPIASVTLLPLTDYFILLEADYPANNVDYIISRYANVFLSDGQLYHFGDGLGMDWQNHPGVVDLNQSYSDVANDIAPSVIWPINSQAVNVPEISPDITSILQAQVDMPNYTADHGMILNLTRLAVTAENRIQRANSFPGNADGPILRVTYEEPVVVVPDKLADPGPGRPRGWEPFDLSYFRTKYQRQMERQRVNDENLDEKLRETEPPTPDSVEIDIARLRQYLVQIEARTQRQAEQARRQQDQKELAELEAQLAAVEAREQAQRALMEQLEQNRIDARAALLLAMELRQRQQNQLAAISAALQYYY